MENWIKNKIDNMTLDDKIGMIHGNALFKNKGVERLGIKPLVMSDGPMSVRFDHKDDEWIPINSELCYVSWLPSGTALASTWNTELAGITGEVLGDEACARGKQVILGPGINIHRTPLCGRNFEYMSEDPYLTGQIAASYIRGVQSKDVAVCVKHFALNNQEKYRMCVDAKVDDRALYEIYLPAFKEAVKSAGAYSVMCSYNKVNGYFASENSRLLNDILKGEWEYDGLVISDWGAVHDTKKAVYAGMDLEMSVTYDFDNYYFAEPLKQMILDGEIEENVLDDKVARILRLQKRIGMYDGTRNKGSYSTPLHHKLLLDAADEALVLLKNDNNLLPLDTKKCKKIAVIGDAATRKLAHGGGSSETTPLFEITPLLGINIVTGADTEIVYAPGYYVDNENHVNGEVDWQATSLDAQNDSREGENNSEAKDIRTKLLNEAVELAKNCDAVIYVGGLNRAYDTEGFDRTSYDLPYNQYEVIDTLINANPNTVISILSGSAVNLTPFNDKAPAILWNSMNGMQGGLALARVIFGEVNPSGKLPVSFPEGLSDCPAHSIGEYPGTGTEPDVVCNYSEGIYVGYRHYITHNIKTLYSFGHGLSYTSFEYSNIVITKKEDGDIDVSFDISNTGDVAGKEIAELYISSVNPAVDKPLLELKGFCKMSLEAGEKKTAHIMLNNDSFAYYNTDKGRFCTDSGEYIISIGSSSTDIRLKISYKLN